MITVVMPAHNEGPVIARTLAALTTAASPGELEVIVVCNGCTDDTATIARSFRPFVRVIETPIANKSHALNIGDQAASGFPRVYTDADVIITFPGIMILADQLNQAGILAVAPEPNFELMNSSWAVRAFYDVRRRVPSFLEGIGGSGVYAISELGRRRFGEFPNIIADDTYVRVQFRPEERRTINSVRSTVFVPRTIRNLINIETRADFGTFELARLFPALWSNKGASNSKALIKLFRHPSLWHKLLVYIYVRAVARYRAKLRSNTIANSWARDETSRLHTREGMS
jgi:glycosyltransferase involved in cell wall biosynthesis